MAKLGGIYVSVRAKTDKYKRDLADAKTLTEKAAVIMQRQFDSISFKQAGVSALAFGATVAFGMKKAIDAASNLEETVGKFDVVFADHSAQAEDMARVLVDSYAMSTREAKQYLSNVQDLLVPMGMVSDQAIIMSNEIVKLSADLASFNNLPTSQVMDDIQSALVGNYETMKKYGVVINETVIKQKALNDGLWNGKGVVDANVKAQLAFRLMLKDSSAAIGDQQRTMGSYANQTKQLRANIEDIAAAIGTDLLPQLTAWVARTNESIKQNPEIIKQIGDFAKTMLDLADAIGGAVGHTVTFFNVWVKTIQAMGLASTGIITWTEALTNGVEAVKRFNAETEGLTFKIDINTPGYKEYLESFNKPQKLGKIKPPPISPPSTADLNKVADLYKELYQSTGLEDYAQKAIEANAKVIESSSNMWKKVLKNDQDVNALRIQEKQKFHDALYSEEIKNIEEAAALYAEAEKKRLEIREEFDAKYQELGLDKFELQRLQLDREVEIYRQAGVEKNKIDEMVSRRSTEIAQAEQLAKLSIYQSIAGGIAGTFKTIADAGGKQSKEAFMVYKAAAMAEATISGHQAVLKALAAAPPPYNFVLAGIAGAATAVQIGMIASASPPSYDVGGISNARGVYQTGDIQEAHVPIPSGKIPVEINGGQEQKSTEITIMNSVDPQVMDAWAASSRGQNAIFNVIGSQPQRMRRMVR